jgi:2-oxoglutarate dehydrogenase E2 component (dihydrolipoamide succinyltransferase)
MTIEFKMPKMGESISEATIISWLKNVGDFVDAEETILEVATDKVDSEVPSPVSGTITEIRFQKDDVVAVGTVLALINSDGKQEPKSEKEEVTNTKVETQPEVSFSFDYKYSSKRKSFVRRSTKYSGVRNRWSYSKK